MILNRFWEIRIAGKVLKGFGIIVFSVLYKLGALCIHIVSISFKLNIIKTYMSCCTLDLQLILLMHTLHIISFRRDLIHNQIEIVLVKI